MRLRSKKQAAMRRQHDHVLHDRSLTSDLTSNTALIMSAFRYPDNIALKLRTLTIFAIHRKAVLFFIEGTADVPTIENHIVRPLIEYPAEHHLKNSQKRHHDASLSELIDFALTTLPVEKIASLKKSVDDLLNGSTILLIEGSSTALSLQTRAFKNRPIEKPTVENNLIGSKEAFVESAEINRSLIRKYMKNHNLLCETMNIGEQELKLVYIMYIQHTANPEIVKQVKERIAKVNCDSIDNLAMLDQHIEERAYSIIPSALLTERPDLTAYKLREGFVALLMDNSPDALIVPVTFWSFFHTPEDQYRRWLNGNFLRLLRIFVIFIAMLVPALYISIATFHTEMLPTDLALAIAATREKVPFSIFIEALFMEISFEIMREAGVRVPISIGPTIGIVAALILGQAAVEANIVSPILVIIVAVTGLSSFVIPNIDLNFGVRIVRLISLFIASMLGFFGISLFLAFLLTYLASLKSYGVLFLSPFAPHKPSSHNLILRSPLKKNRFRTWLRKHKL